MTHDNFRPEFMVNLTQVAICTFVMIEFFKKIQNLTKENEIKLGDNIRRRQFQYFTLKEILD